MDNRAPLSSRLSLLAGLFASIVWFLGAPHSSHGIVIGIGHPGDAGTWLKFVVGTVAWFIVGWGVARGAFWVYHRVARDAHPS